MTEEELIQFLKKNLKIKLTRFDTGYLCIGLFLGEKEISESSIDTPVFKELVDETGYFFEESNIQGDV